MSPWKLLTALRSRILSSPNIGRAIFNTLWLFANQIVRLSVGLVVSVLLARYLGASVYGLYSLAGAIVTIFMPIQMMGLNTIIVRDLLNNDKDNRQTMGSGFVIQSIGGVIVVVLSCITSSLIRPENQFLMEMVLILSSVALFRSSELVKYWYEARVLSKFVVWIQIGVFIVTSIIKVCLIFLKAPLIYIVWTNFADGVCVSVALFILFFTTDKRIGLWKSTLEYIVSLLKQGFPLLLSGIAIIIYMKIDQLMIGYMLADRSLGVYTAAVNISEAWYFVPMAIMASIYPSLVVTRQNNYPKYLERNQLVCNYMTILSASVALIMTLFSDRIIGTLFGADFMNAAAVLSIYAWAGVFVSLGLTSGRWLITEGMEIIIFYRAIFGAIVNVILNLVLIPRYGIIGSAIATLISYFVASFSVLIFKRSRPVGIMMLKSLLPLKLSEQPSR